jgi:carbon-monoxide dehydrogenase large subunit
MDILARELKMDPAEVRRKNFIPASKFPYQTQMGAVYDSGDYAKALDTALAAAGWNDLKKQRDEARTQGRLVGLGLAMYVEVCGIGPSAILPTGGWEHSQVTIERDGRISATTGASPHGQGNETTFAQMLADQFGVPRAGSRRCRRRGSAPVRARCATGAHSPASAWSEAAPPPRCSGHAAAGPASC